MAVNESKEALPGQCILMLAVALDELRSTEAETDLEKVRRRIASVESNLKALLEVAKQAAGDSGRLGL